MSKIVLNRYQNRKKGFTLLRRGLGVRGYIQFMQDFGLNEGDYTKDKEKWLAEKSVVESSYTVTTADLSMRIIPYSPYAAMKTCVMAICVSAARNIHQQATDQFWR